MFPNDEKAAVAADYLKAEPAEAPSMLSEVTQANERLLMEQMELVSELERKLRPVINQRNGEDDGMDNKTKADNPFSPHTNNLLTQGDAISATNRRIRNLIRMVEV